MYVDTYKLQYHPRIDCHLIRPAPRYLPLTECTSTTSCRHCRLRNEPSGSSLRFSGKQAACSMAVCYLPWILPRGLSWSTEYDRESELICRFMEILMCTCESHEELCCQHRVGCSCAAMPTIHLSTFFTTLEPRCPSRAGPGHLCSLCIDLFICSYIPFSAQR